MREVALALRTLAAAPAFAATAILSLTIGIGANTAIFSVIDALWLRVLPIAKPHELVVFRTSGTFGISRELFDRLGGLREVFSAVATVVRTDRYNVTVSGAAHAGDPGATRVALVSARYFDTIGIAAARGRTLVAADDRPGAPPVVMISDGYRARQFSAGADPLQSVVTIHDTAFAIVGVVPPSFAGEWVGRPVDLWIPLAQQPQVMVETPGLQIIGTVFARLQPGVAIDRARAVAQTTVDSERAMLTAANPGAPILREAWRIDVESAANGFSPQRGALRLALSVLMGAVALVLLIACANIANLLLARSTARRREIAVRLAIGAGRGRIARQLLTESVVLAALGAIGGGVFAVAATRLLATYLQAGPVSGAPLDLDLRIDPTILIFAMLITIRTGLLFGLAPVLRAGRIPLAAALVARGADTGRVGAFRVNKALVIAQVALSMILLIGAALFARTLHNLRAQPLGFDRAHTLLIWTLPGQTSGRGPNASELWHAILERLALLPGVEIVSASNQGVLNGSEPTLGGPPLRVEGEAPRAAGLPGLRSFVTPDFFRAMGIPLIAGREFTERDTAGAPRGVVITESMGRYYFGAANPVGRHVGFGDDTGTPTEIIGVVRDFTNGTPRESARLLGTTYFSYRDKEAARRLRNMMIAVRTSADPLSLSTRVRQELQAIDPNLPVLRIDTVDQQLDEILALERLVATLSGFFSVTAVLLACIGLSGVIAYTVARRASEIGVRLALGASPRTVRAMVLRESLMLVGAGVFAGVPIAFGLTRLVSARLFGVTPGDPLTIAASAALLVAIATAAALVPAQRAARIDPIVTLRCE